MPAVKRKMPNDTWVYRSVDIWLPKPIVKFLDSYIIGDKTTLFYLNYWHINHFLSGIIFGLFQLSFLQYLILHTLWELWQLWIGMTPRTLRGFVDTLVDTGVGLLGWFLGLRLEGKQ